MPHRALEQCGEGAGAGKGEVDALGAGGMVYVLSPASGRPER
jgi:hypothetical protein